MYESGYYPAGAENDPRAPWNEREPTYVECAACGGKGYHYHAYDINTGSETECTEQTYNLLPEDEDEAIARGQHFCKGEMETCDVCDGEGEVEYEPDYDDYDED